MRPDGPSAFLFNLEEEPLIIGGRSIFAPWVGGGVPALLEGAGADVVLPVEGGCEA